MMSSVSAVLFARDARRLAQFYVAVFGAAVSTMDADHAALDLGAFRLVIHQIPGHLAKDIEIRVPPLRRESGAIRLDYPVEHVVDARSAAKHLGGQIDDAPPPWADTSSRFRLGFDPEGNVFGVSDVRA
jgi:predicted enzyme related to lactoylglutathione lyase